MAFTFNINYVPTGCLAIGFKVEAPDTAPETITVRHTDPELTVTTLDPIEVFPTGKSDYFLAGLTTALAFDTAYTVEILIDDAVVHTQELEMPAPGARRSPVLRQRLFEVLLDAYNTGEIESQPFGSRHTPSSVNISFLKQKGTFIEVSPAYVSNMSYDNATASIQEVVVPFVAFAAIDSKEDTESLSEDFEEVQGYLLETSWRLNAFGLIQSSARFENQEPQIDPDRNAVKIESQLIVNMRRNF